MKKQTREPKQILEDMIDKLKLHHNLSFSNSYSEYEDSDTKQLINEAEELLKKKF